MYRILKPGGILVATVPAYKWYWSMWDVVLHHKRRYGSRDIQILLTQNGFRIQKQSFVYSFLVIPGWLIRSVKMVISKASYGSDFRLVTPNINTIMLFLCRIEAQVVMGGYVPFGTSIVVVAKKSP